MVKVIEKQYTIRALDPMLADITQHAEFLEVDVVFNVSDEGERSDVRIMLPKWYISWCEATKQALFDCIVGDSVYLSRVKGLGNGYAHGSSYYLEIWRELNSLFNVEAELEWEITNWRELMESDRYEPETWSDR